MQNDCSYEGDNQREGMGPLKNQTLPSLCDWFMTVFSVHLVTDQPQIGASGVVHQSKQHGPSIMYKITPC
jgi:hypothetical protein